jgi:hypothetical protein
MLRSYDHLQVENTLLARITQLTTYTRNRMQTLKIKIGIVNVAVWRVFRKRLHSNAYGRFTI